METRRSFGSGISSMGGETPRRMPAVFFTAVLSAGVLLFAIVSALTQKSTPQFDRPMQSVAAENLNGNAGIGVNMSDLAAGDTAAATSDIAMVGPEVVGTLAAQYQNLQSTGSYSPEVAAAFAEQLGKNAAVTIPYKTYSASDININSDTSYKGMLAYRARLKEALAPIAGVKDLEIGVFGAYEQTKDPAYLKQLRTIIDDYAAAASSSAALSVPSDAVSYHVDILNAMNQFGATLEALVDNASDPITVVTLLNSYNDAENTMISSFNNLAQYFAHHPQP